MTTAGIIWATISRKFSVRRPGTYSFESANALGAAMTSVSATAPRPTTRLVAR